MIFSAGYDLFDHKLPAAEDLGVLFAAVGADAAILQYVEDGVAFAAQGVTGEDLDAQFGILQQGTVHGGRVAGLNVLGHNGRQLAHLENEGVDLADAVLVGKALHGADHVEHDT